MNRIMGIRREQPRHEHDCDGCVFLGIFENYDLYLCPTEPTLIARRGVDGDYISGMAFIPHYPALLEAFKRAQNAGLIEVAVNPDWKNRVI